MERSSIFLAISLTISGSEPNSCRETGPRPDGSASVFGIFVMIKNRLCADHFRTDHSCSLLMAEQTNGRSLTPALALNHRIARLTFPIVSCFILLLFRKHFYFLRFPTAEHTLLLPGTYFPLQFFRTESAVHPASERCRKCRWYLFHRQ